MSNLTQALLIGVDGGGTGCRVAIGTERDGVLADASGGRANVATDLPLAIRNIENTVSAALAKFGGDPGDLRRAVAHLGLAGVMTPQDASRVCDALPYAKCVVTDDRPTALVGALGERDGFLVSVGTGTIMAARRAGQFRYVGGWGFYLSDQASGAWLGRAALVRVLLCVDGLLGHTDLTRDLLAKFNNDPNEIVAFSVGAVPGDYGAFAPAVFDAAGRGDAIGLVLVEEGVDYILRGLSVLGFRDGDILCLTGGAGPRYEAFLPEAVRQGITPPGHSAVHGAFQMARVAAQESARVPS